MYLCIVYPIMSEESKQEITNKSKFYNLAIFGVILFVAGAILSGFVIKEQPQVLGLSAQSEVTSLTSKIGKLIVLPSNESPTATTISDVKKLKGQFFFRNAKKNDKLLVYPNAKWAVLYRPSQNKIIEAGAFSGIQEVVATPTAIPSPTPTLTPTPSISTTPTLTPGVSPVLSPAED